MKKITSISAFLISIVACNAQQPSESVSKFAFDLYRNVSKDKSENIVFAPFSISPAFSMVYLGTKDESEKQISQVFYFPRNQSSFHSSMGKLQSKIQSDAGNAVDISITNRVWMEKSYKVERQFKKSLQKSYKAKLGTLDFIGQPEQSRVEINKVVETDTKHFIKNLLPQGSISDLTRLVLTNAIYFKGKWEKQFDPKKTTQRGFTLSSGDEIKCATMFVEDSMGYYVGNSYSAIQLNYKGKKLSMLILLPNENIKIADFEKELTFDLYKSTLANLENEKVAVLLPKFKIETGLSLKSTLSDMGMPIPFSDAADLSGISGKKDLKISNAFHKAYIEVSEEGTTAAAATAVVIAMKSFMRKTEFIVNRPFIYILKHNDSNTTLFMGKVENPNK
ncbi:MAG: serpin family protein [Bacteroidales bacterium]